MLMYFQTAYKLKRKNSKDEHLKKKNTIFFFFFILSTLLCLKTRWLQTKYVIFENMIISALKKFISLNFNFFNLL